uniref:tRNA_int_endo_N domain-containing protein n=1 Tax=Macrostomum lignano TaxID=282301 RepID=A0A1I8F381_9PLAT
ASNPHANGECSGKPVDEEFLFDPQLLFDLDWAGLKSRTPVTACGTMGDLRLRPLSSLDFDRARTTGPLPAATLIREAKVHQGLLLPRGTLRTVPCSGVAPRGRELGKLGVRGCWRWPGAGIYKVSLDCHEAMVPFYEKFGLKKVATAS